MIHKLTKISFYSLALIPLLKENYNSICIILFTLLTIFDIIKNKRELKIDKTFLFSAGIFLTFLLYQIIQIPDFDFKGLFKHLPFLIIPFIFIYCPKFIGIKEKKISMTIFQVSVLLQCLIYVINFLLYNDIGNFFHISNENIPFFREYVLNNYLFRIHPTYFSVYLLISFTLSLFKLKELKGLNLFNIGFTVFFIFLFSSRIVIVAFFLTVVYYIFYRIRRLQKKQMIISIGFVIVIGILIIIPNKDILFKRFHEITTEINKPVKGNYYNSTNTRIAIIKCSVDLFERLPFLGYGNSLQLELNNCYKSKFDSDFYKISKFNTHNYYIHTILFGGYLYFILFLLFLLWIYKLIRKSKIGLLIFIQFLIINLTENYLLRHYGIITFMYIMSLFIFIKPKEDRK